jgi:ABC-type Fe3+/spermidine/putrescine transport system ATPase subunit
LGGEGAAEMSDLSHATALTLDRLTARYGEHPVLRDFTLDVAGGELVALLGPSGCGKTTVLKIIAGLLQPVSGEVRFNGESVLRVPAEKRGAVMVFQKPLLFPYLTVAENVAFGLKMRRSDKIRERVSEMLRLLQLEGYEARRPSQLSGGQEQRVALARALVTEPRVLLLDEPFSALDENLRTELRLQVRELQKRLGITTIFVTHDQVEAAMVSDRIALLLDGRVEQFGAPRDFYTSPSTVDVARFFGWQVFETGASGDQSIVAFRPERATLRALNGRPPEDEELMVKLIAVSDLGTRIRYRVLLADGTMLEIEQEIDKQSNELRPGDQAVVRLQAGAIVRFAGTL